MTVEVEAVPGTRVVAPELTSNESQYERDSN